MTNFPLRPSPSSLRLATQSACLSALAILLGTSSGAWLHARATTVGGPHTVRYLPGVVADVCTLSSTNGELGVQQDRKLIASDPAALSGPSGGSAKPATITVSSNMGNGAVIVADQPTLIGPTAPSTSALSLGGQPYAPSSTLTTGADGSLTGTLNVRFQSERFSSGTYQATAVVTCTDDGSR